MTHFPSEESPIYRRAGRVIVIDDLNRVLLLQGTDPMESGAPWWFTPGGGAEDGESALDAARRELFEETGLDAVDLEGPLWRRVAHFQFMGKQYEQHEEFFFTRISTHDLIDDMWTEIERATVLAHRWWSIDDLVATDEQIFPARLGQLIDSLLRQGAPESAFDIE